MIIKSERNKTIDISVEDGQKYLEKCIYLDKKTNLTEILNKTIIGDTFKMLQYLPKNSIDLLIIDPPL